MTYDELLFILKENSDEKFAEFQSILIKSPKEKVIGVKTPILRRIAKSISVEDAFTFPNDYYEVKLIKLLVVSYLRYEDFLLYLDEVVPLIDNWALCDSFKAECIKDNKEKFLPWIEKYYMQGKEFSVRYALVTLLWYYIVPEYLPMIFEYLQGADCQLYYVHMAVAWLTAEILIKNYEQGVCFLQKKQLDIKTHNKAIQKAIESYRLTKEQKEYLKTLKIKK